MIKPGIHPRYSSKAAAQANARLFILCTILTTAATLAAILPVGRLSLAATATSGICISAIIYSKIKISLPSLLGLRVFIVAQQLPLIALFLFSLICRNDALFEFPVFEIASNPLRTIVGVLAPAIGCLLLAFSAKAMPQDGKAANIKLIAARADDRLQVVLIGCALLQSLIWITTDSKFIESGWAYIHRIIYSALVFVPFLAGYYAEKFRMALAAWLMVLLFGVVLAGFTGSRGYAFIPLGYLSVGFFFGLRNLRERLVWSIRLSPAFAIGVALAGVIDATRTEVGRGGLERTSSTEIALTLSRAKEILRFGQGSTDATSVELGLSRFVPWSNLVVPVMSPASVPFRGWDDLGEELRSLYKLGRFTGSTYSSNDHANNYGFLVSSTTSVEFGIAADGWSRMGLLGAILYGFVFAAALYFAEIAAKRLSRDSSNIYLLVFAILANASIFDATRTGLFACLRSLVANLVWAVPTFLVAQHIITIIQGRPRLRGRS